MNKIKTIIPTMCPCCKKEILIEYTITAPTLESVFKPEDVEMAKKDAIEQINSLSIDQEKKNETISWIKDENTIFGPSEVSKIIMSLVNPEDSI